MNMLSTQEWLDRWSGSWWSLGTEFNQIHVRYKIRYTWKATKIGQQIKVLAAKPAIPSSPLVEWGNVSLSRNSKKSMRHSFHFALNQSHQFRVGCCKYQYRPSRQLLVRWRLSKTGRVQLRSWWEASDTGNHAEGTDLGSVPSWKEHRWSPTGNTSCVRESEYLKRI